MRVNRLVVLGSVFVMGLGFAACRSSSGGGGTGGNGTGATGGSGTGGSGATAGTAGTGATAGSGGSGGAVGGSGGAMGGAGGAATCSPATSTVSINSIDIGTTGAKQVVGLKDVVATSQKFLTYKSKTKGSCLWAVFATDGGQTTEGPSTSIMIVSYGTDAVTTDAGVGPCAAGTDAIPDDVKPGDILEVPAAQVDPYVPGTCPVGTAAAFQLNATAKCKITQNGTAKVPPPHVLTTTEANTIAAGTDTATLAKWGGALVELDGAIPNTADGGTFMDKYGTLSFSNVNLTAGDKIFYDALPNPGTKANAWSFAAPPASFSKIVGNIYLDYCTYEIAPRDKCTDVTPPSDGCPVVDGGI